MSMLRSLERDGGLRVVEHHLSPDMPSTRYGEIAPRVKAICEKYELPYNTGPLFKQLGTVQRIDPASRPPRRRAPPEARDLSRRARPALAGRRRIEMAAGSRVRVETGNQRKVGPGSCSPSSSSCWYFSSCSAGSVSAVVAGAECKTPASLRRRRIGRRRAVPARALTRRVTWVVEGSFVKSADSGSAGSTT